jgi:hypothetical protein
MILVVYTKWICAMRENKKDLKREEKQFFATIPAMEEGYPQSGHTTHISLSK